MRVPISIGCSVLLKVRENVFSKIRSSRFSTLFRTIPISTVPVARYGHRRKTFLVSRLMLQGLGRVAKLADAQASGACIRKDVGVQVPPRPPCDVSELLGRLNPQRLLLLTA